MHVRWQRAQREFKMLCSGTEIKYREAAVTIKKSVKESSELSSHYSVRSHTAWQSSEFDVYFSSGDG